MSLRIPIILKKSFFFYKFYYPNFGSCLILLLTFRNRELDIETVFKNVQSDFQKLNSMALSEKMKPEYRSSLGQAMYLGANLRNSSQ